VALGTHVLALGRLSLGHAALGGGLVHFILRLIIWRVIWRFVMLIWHIRAFGPGLLLLVLFALVLWVILRSRRRRGDTGGRPGDPRDDRGSSGPDSRD
jgi:hypothetical protein